MGDIERLIPGDPVIIKKDHFMSPRTAGFFLIIFGFMGLMRVSVDSTSDALAHKELSKSEVLLYWGCEASATLTAVAGIGLAKKK